MRPHQHGGALLVVALLVVVAACTPGAEEDDRRAVEVTLFGGPAEVAAYRELALAFEAANPDVRVVLNPLASQDDLLANLTTAFAGGQPPDVFLLNYLRYGRFAAQGVIAEAQDLLDRDGTNLGDLAEPSLDAFRFDGERLTCMPQNASSLVAYVNLDAFAAAGVEVPRDGWDTDDLLAAARALTDPDEDRYGIGFDMSLQRLAPFAWSAGGELVDDEANPTRLTLDDPATRRALDVLLDLQLVHGVAPPDREAQSLDAQDRFITGRLGVYLDSRAAVPTLRDGIADTFAWDVVPLPAMPDSPPVTVLHGDAWCLAADGDVDLGWRFVSFAMSAEGQTLLAESGRTVPSRADVARSSAFLEPDQPPSSATVFLDAIPRARSLPRTASWAEMQREVDDLLTDAFLGRLDTQTAVSRAMATAEAVFSQDPFNREGP